ncbi:MAG: hypothetical protein LBH58_04715 [Tannerellaceae bacterium]|jgi:hypothetical protein|nr:hypothetical protein [Tannerellaceae bacterium]
MEKTTFNINARRPTEEEVGKLIKVPNGKKPVSKLEKKRFFKNMFILLAIGTACFFLGDWLLGGRDTSSITSLGKLIGFLFLFGLKWVVPPMLLIFILSEIPTSAQKKTIEGAMNWVFIKSLFSLEDSSGIQNFGSNDFAAKKYARIAPDALNVPDKQILDYVVKFRKYVEKAVEKEIAGKSLSTPDVHMTITSSAELFPDVVEVNAILTFGANVKFEKLSGKSETYCASKVVMNIAYVLVKSDDFWYPYDMFPKITAPLLA